MIGIGPSTVHNALESDFKCHNIRLLVLKLGFYKVVPEIFCPQGLPSPIQ